MKLLLCTALLLLGAQLSEFACFFQAQKTDERGKCFDLNDGTYHDIGEDWPASNCWVCVCARGGYTCCERYFNPTGFPNDCVVTFDFHSCRFRAHLKKDLSVDCAKTAVIGK